MIISPHIQERMTRTTGSTETPVLRDGQIVEGKILKIHPNNRAEIQIGPHKMVAEVTTSLSVGRQYHFQVEANDQVIQLKVIGDHLKQDAKTNIAQLVQQLGLKPTKVTVDFVQQLLQERIPFNQAQLVQAAQILEKAPSKSEAMQILKEMLQTRMPITNNVFQALLATKEHRVSNLLQQLQEVIQADPKANPSEKRLLQTIQGLMNRPIPLEQKLTNELLRRDSPLASLLKLAGHIPARANVATVVQGQLNSHPTMTKDTIVQEANKLNQSSANNLAQRQENDVKNQAVNRQLLTNDPKIINRQVMLNALQSNASSDIKSEQVREVRQETSNQAQVRLPTFEQVMKALWTKEQITDKSIATRFTAIQETMQHMLKHEASIQTAANRISNVFQGLQAGILTEDQFVLARHMIQEQLMPQLQTSMQAKIEPLLSQPTKENQQMLAQQLKVLSQNETYNIIRMISTETEADRTWQQQAIQKQFISHVTQFMQVLGLKDEYSLKQAIQQSIEQGTSMPTQQGEPTSIKSLLLQLSNSQNSIGTERIQQMLHFINGMQLQSVQESNNQFMHVSMQVPGEKLGLNEDMYMQFEGQKTADDQIDPDYCRILFVLHLEKIDQTIIDMHVQKRIISLTIYNENEHVRSIMNKLQGPFKKKLHDMDYQVSSISLKPLYEDVVAEQNKKVREAIKSEEERFDFRI